LLVRRPLAVLGAYLIVTVIGLVLAAVLALARAHVPALGGAGTLGALVLAQLLVLVLGWMRSARLFALMAVARDKRV
jgi:energy-converting hydrogenase Eha subunit B